MIAYIARRLVLAVVLMLVISAVTFMIFFLVPRIAGVNSDALAARYAGKAPTPQQIVDIKHRLGFDKPLVVQYGEYAKGLVAGRSFDNGGDKIWCNAPCFGYSFKTDQPVRQLLTDRAPITFSIALGAAILWLISGVIAGVISALRKGSITDRVVMLIALAGVSLPVFFTALVAQALMRKANPSATIQYVNLADNPVGWAQNLILPWVTLALLYAALYARLTRAGMLDTMSEDYIRTARAKGLPERTVIVRHALRGTLTPILTIFGLDLGLLLGGAFLTETAFSMHGLGQLALAAINENDLPVVLGVTTLTAGFVVIANLAVDLLYAVVDPRVRIG
ncbi:MAG: dppB5 [Actinoallomurus sp.]|nr:dppB5 [Actinoallomurus sp.]